MTGVERWQAWSRRRPVLHGVLARFPLLVFGYAALTAGLDTWSQHPVHDWRPYLLHGLVFAVLFELASALVRVLRRKPAGASAGDH